jgi:membrane-bound hydrogenase subunit beta
MIEPAQLQEHLTSRFPMLIGVSLQRERRLWAEATPEQFREVFEHAVDVLGFSLLCTITGLDDKETLAAIYHLARPDGWVLCLRNRVPKQNPVMKTVSDRFPAAIGYERELIDLLGFRVEGLPAGKRYPLPDAFPVDQHPLRKDWKKPAKVAAS